MEIEPKYEFHFTKEELLTALQLGDDFVWDYALPQDWVNETTKNGYVKKYGFKYEDITSNFVWMYGPGSKTFGRPFPLTTTGHAILKLIKGV